MVNSVQLPLPLSKYYNNKNLFSNYYLEEILPKLHEFTSQEHTQAFEKIRELYKNKSSFGSLNEAQLEERLFKPIFKILGFEYEVQADVGSGTDFPDYALFLSRDRIDEISLGTERFYNNALAIGEVKRWTRELDRTGRDKQNKSVNPSFQIWIYLNKTNVNWGILTNGRVWRLYRKGPRTDTYFEVNLENICSLGDINGFKYFYYFFRKEAFISLRNEIPFLDRILVGSIEYALKVGEDLKDNVYNAMKILAQGFVNVTSNRLNQNIDEDLKKVQQNSMKLLYRLIFILYAEGKGLLDEESYKESPYSLFSLKHEIANKKDSNLIILPNGLSYWSRLNELFNLINKGSEAAGIPKTKFFVPAYNGGLFDPDKNQFLFEKQIGDQAIADAIDLLARTRAADGSLKFVDYSTLEIRHLGSIYEGLLEYQLKIATEQMVTFGDKLLWNSYSDYSKNRKKIIPFEDFPESERVQTGQLYIATTNGERKSSGSFYTPDHIVEYIIKNTIGPTIDSKIQQALVKNESAKDAILSIKVIDPAMGSGHFLVGAIDSLSASLMHAIQIDVEHGRISEEDAHVYTLESTRRDIVTHCIYGVDLNEMAVELAKVSLWLTTISKDKPLSFLDHRLKCGNSLIGSRIVDIAWLPGQRPKNITGTIEAPLGLVKKILGRLEELNKIPENTVDQIKKKEQLFYDLKKSDEYVRIKDLADIHTGLFFINQDHESIRNRYMNIANEAYFGNPKEWSYKINVSWATESIKKSTEQRFFHWELEFPEIFFDMTKVKENPGFDAVVGNPPYINALELARTGNPLEREYIRKHNDSGKGAFDLYIPFIELGIKLTQTGGRSGLITPNKFLAAPYGKALREYMVKHSILERFLNVSQIGVFEDPSVYPIVTIFYHATLQTDSPIIVELKENSVDKTKLAGTFPQGFLKLFPDYLWSFLLTRNANMILRLATECKMIKDVAFVQASTTASEADELSNYLVDYNGNENINDYFPVINTGLIDRYTIDWGFEKMTNAHKTYYRPCFRKVEGSISEMRRNLFQKKKLVVAKLALVPELCYDDVGNIAGLNVNFIFDSLYNLTYLLAVMNSKLMSVIYREYFGALTMSGEYAQFQAPQLEILPIPDTKLIESIEIESKVANYSARLHEVVEFSDYCRVMVDLNKELENQATKQFFEYQMLSDLGDNLFKLYKSRKEVASVFVDWIKSPVGLGIDTENLSNSTKVRRFFEDPKLGTQEGLLNIERILSKNKIQLSSINLQKLMNEYTSISITVSKINMKIEMFEKITDYLCYKSYGLSCDEIATIEHIPIEDIKKKYALS